jgi:hypothetical protein
MSNTKQRTASSKKTSQSSPTKGGSAANRKFNERQQAKFRAAANARRHRRNRMVGFGSIVLALVVLVVLVVVKVGGGRSVAPADVSPAAGTPIKAAITNKLAAVPLGTLAAASTASLTTSPQAMSDAALQANGKPDLLYVGAEFCPICASERWAMYVALSKFGTFSPQPGQIHSATRDGNIPTLTFYKTTYTSPYLTFTPVETTTNQPEGNSYVPLQTPTATQERLWISHTGGTFPWVDFAGKSELTSAQYNPADLEGLTFYQIAADVGNNATAVGTDIDASAKVLVQTICSQLSGNQPASVCRGMTHA